MDENLTRWNLEELNTAIITEGHKLSQHDSMTAASMSDVIVFSVL